MYYDHPADNKMLGMYPQSLFEKGFLQDAYYNLWKIFPNQKKTAVHFGLY